MAFLLVLASLILQKNSSQEQIGALNESNASAITRAEQLQTLRSDLLHIAEQANELAAQ